MTLHKGRRRVSDKIVENIWNAKARRQLIFASHSANLVVNGDAELVVSFDYRVSGDASGGKVSSEGAIDVPETNAVIKRVMEGGEEAFKLRKAKYGFEVRRPGLHTCTRCPARCERIYEKVIRQ